MKKLIAILLCIAAVVTLLSSCGSRQSFDGKDRPSLRGQLRVVDGTLCGDDGKPVMLRGISCYGVSVSERYITDETFYDIYPMS